MRVAFAAAVVGTLGLLAQPAWSSDDDAREWIERMSESLATRNYVGLFTHTTSRQSETMRIVHRVGKNGSTERLVSLDGSGREIVRTPQEVHVYMPDRGIVQVSTNLTNYEETPLVRVFDRVKQEASRYGVAVLESEIIGLAPQAALEGTSAGDLQLVGFSADRLLEHKLHSGV